MPTVRETVCVSRDSIYFVFLNIFFSVLFFRLVRLSHGRPLLQLTWQARTSRYEEDWMSLN